MNYPSIILLGLAIIIVANVAGHYFPPLSLLSSFIYMNFIVGVVNRELYKGDFKLTVIYNFALLLANDLLIRLYAGGIHDSQGKAWFWMMFHIGFVIAVFIMGSQLMSLQKEDKSSWFSNFNVLTIATIVSAVFYNFVNSGI